MSDATGKQNSTLLPLIRTKTESTIRNGIVEISIPLTEELKYYLNKAGDPTSPFVLGKLHEGYTSTEIILHKLFAETIKYCSFKDNPVLLKPERFILVYLKVIHMENSTFSRRRFLGTTVGAAALAMMPFKHSFAIGQPSQKPNSKVNGVQLGLTTYCYRSIPHNLDEVLQYVLASGVNSLEMRSVLEEGLGIPQGPPRPGRGVTLSDAEKAERAKAAAELREKQRLWRLSLPMQKYADIRKKYNDAGVNIHIAKFVPSGWSDEEIDYAFNAAKTLGAYGITDEFTDEVAQRLGKFAEKHNSLAIYHTHGQFGQPGFDIDKYLGYSKANRLNLDIGHYFGSTGLHPNGIIEKYHHLIPSIHVKDKTGPNNAQPNQNRPFGQGETPIADVLLLIKKEKWPINVDLELEYEIPEGSDPVKEVTKCMEYMRNILE